MAGILSICKVTVAGSAAPGGSGPQSFHFLGSSCYANLKDLTGVEVIKPENWGNDEPLIQVGALLKAGKVQRLTAPITVGTGTNAKTRYVSLIVAKDKVPTIEAKNSLQGKDYSIIIKDGTNTKKGTFDNNAYQKRQRVRKSSGITCNN